MVNLKKLLASHRRRLVALASTAALLLSAGYFYLYGQDKSGFPDGFDAVQAAPHSHKVIFENDLVRVLEVTIPPPGTTEPMHHHRWPGFFLSWDTGGGAPHVRYHTADGKVRDQPADDAPRHPGKWDVRWMKPEPMHAIEVVDAPASATPQPGDPPLLRIEIKCHP